MKQHAVKERRACRIGILIVRLSLLDTLSSGCIIEKTVCLGTILIIALPMNPKVIAIALYFRIIGASEKSVFIISHMGHD
jgi:hypothetical protein